MLFGRARSPSYAVPAGTSSEEKYHISRHRTFAAHVISLDSSDHRTDFKSLCKIAGVIYLPYVRGRKPYLIAVT